MSSDQSQPQELLSKLKKELKGRASKKEIKYDLFSFELDLKALVQIF